MVPQQSDCQLAKKHILYDTDIFIYNMVPQRSNCLLTKKHILCDRDIFIYNMVHQQVTVSW